MSGFFGVASKENCIFDLFFGTDYHSHLGTRRAGIAVFGDENGFSKSIHSIENTPFRTKFDGELKPQFDKAKARVEEAQAEEKVIQKSFNEKFAKASEDFKYVQGFINELQRKEDEVKRFYDGKFKEAQKRYQSLNDFLLAFEESETRTQRMYDESFTAMEGVFENGSLLIEDISRKLDSAGQTMLAQDGAISKSFA